MGEEQIGVEGLALADKTLKPVPRLSRSPAHQSVASYCGKGVPGRWDVGAPSLLYCQGPQLTGGGGAAQFCLIGQLKRWWSAVWGKAHRARCQLVLGVLFLWKNQGEEGQNFLGQEVGGLEWIGKALGKRGDGHTHPYQATNLGSGSGSPTGAEPENKHQLAGGLCPSPVGPESCPRAPGPYTSGCQPGEKGVEDQESSP